QQELCADVGGERVVVNARAREGEAAELIGAAKGVDVVVVGEETCVGASEPRLGVVERHAQGVGRLIGERAVKIKPATGAGVELHALAEGGRGGTDSGQTRAAAEGE